MDWIRGGKLGQGSFATVSLAAPRGRSTGHLPPLMAVKSCGFSRSSSLAAEKLILDELQDCPEVIRCFGDGVSYESGEKLYNVLFEYAAGGALADRVRNSGDRGLPECEVRRYTKGLLRGIDYIHKVGFVHGDIKLQNILLDSDAGVKIADFGLAKRIGGGSVRGFELRGTPLYMAPEMVTGGDVGAPSDIWAVACAVAEMVTGYPVWRCSDLAGLLMKIGGDESPEIPETLSTEGKGFLGKCFVKDQSKRWTAEMLLDHPFICGQDLEERQGNSASTSPRCPFDFPEWAASSASCSMTILPLPQECSLSAGRLVEIVSCKGPDWSVSDDWVTVR